MDHRTNLDGVLKVVSNELSVVSGAYNPSAVEAEVKLAHRVSSRSHLKIKSKNKAGERTVW